MEKPIVADGIRRIVAERGLKNRAVAKRAGYSEQQFSAMLNGRKTIKDSDIIAIANALEVTPNDLFIGPSDTT